MADPAFNVLSLCAGIGAFDLSLRLAVPGARSVCFVEREAHAAACLAARMEEGSLDAAPVWSDLTTFDARPWRGVVDCVASGLPCQPYSCAGKREGHADERALWPSFVRIVEECEPAVIFLENVPPFLRFYGPVWERLHGLGFVHAPPLLATAHELGSIQRRRRLFILAAHPERRGGLAVLAATGSDRVGADEPELRGQQQPERGAARRAALAGTSGADAAVPDLAGLQGWGRRDEPERAGELAPAASDCESSSTEGERHERTGATRNGRARPSDSGDVSPDTESIGRTARRAESDGLWADSGHRGASGSGDIGWRAGERDLRRRERDASRGTRLAPVPYFTGLDREWGGWLFDRERQTLRHDAHRCGLRCGICGTPWAAESPVVRVDSGPTRRVERLRAVGNVGTPPVVGAAAFHLLARRLGLAMTPPVGGEARKG